MSYKTINYFSFNYMTSAILHAQVGIFKDFSIY